MGKVIHIWCDESDKRGKYFSNFYGGVLVKNEDLDEVNEALSDIFRSQNLHKEVKWQKVTVNYLEKYQAVMNTFFDLVKRGKIKVRIMFTSNAIKPLELEEVHKHNEYFLLYYQFFKHAFGLRFSNPSRVETHLRIYFDHLPDTNAKKKVFKNYIHRLQNQVEFKEANLLIDKEHIAEVDSNKHMIMQCMDVVLGSICFRLNDKHKEIPEGQKRRGKRTIAKEKLYKFIVTRIRGVYPNFNIGITTGKDGDWTNYWHHPYRHWLFKSSKFERDDNLSKRKSSFIPTSRS